MIIYIIHLLVIMPLIKINFTRLCGFPPFFDDDNTILFEKIKKGKFDFPSPSWDNISPEAIDLIKHLLVVNPNMRMTPE